MKIGIIGMLLIQALALYTLTGCMQLTGAKKITMGTWSIEANSGFEVAAGVQQYDHVNDVRAYNAEKTK